MKNNLKRFILLPLLCISSFLYSQEDKDSIPITERYILFKGDTLLIELDEIFLLKNIKFRTDYDRKYYYWYQKKTLKAYPYAKLAADRLEVLNSRLDSIKSNRKKKAYIKVIQNYMEGEFTEQLKQLTRTEGEILIKLIHRQTGKTVFDLVKDYRSGWKAFWYNATASMFSLSLKDEYNPAKVKEDYMIEDILQRAFSAGIIPYQSSKLDFSFIELEKKWIEAPTPKVKPKAKVKKQ
ncbi:DUF4294 domain-containing protein [Lutibacter sp.]|uniref:DUF4294 domain-containing protein n=1 Tax=Lutibacter sp. TaxID=1925666 RepID=UPI00273571C1|nr:DUF4294 domain-containing protein [Lutibacter sp.]MDP3312530.1 DUF4294 domain-containing protein [Lutibacter sp.]